jgi:hypothetical protein
MHGQPLLGRKARMGVSLAPRRSEANDVTETISPSVRDQAIALLNALDLYGNLTATREGGGGK